MQVLLLALFLTLFLHDEARSLVSGEHGLVTVLAVVVLPKLCVIGCYAAVCQWALRGLASDDGVRRFRRVDLAGTVFRACGLALFMLDLHMGLLLWVRVGFELLTGLWYPVLIDEMLAMLPTLAYWGAGWSVYYPIERRLREAALIRRLDQGLPVDAVWSRWQYVLSQYRYQVALILLPLLAVITWTDAVGVLIDRRWASHAAEGWLTVGGCAMIFLFAPLMIRLAWDTVPLPEGEIRTHLMSMCKAHRVKVRELLLWRTYGGMINAAVMGFIGPLRYILITDGLLQQLNGPHVEAVMAHELAHVRKRHMVWLVLSAVALAGFAEAAAILFLALSGVTVESIEGAFAVTAPEPGFMSAGFAIGGLGETELLLIAAMVDAAAVWALGFGWVSRRAERQADSFAVAHLARERGGETIEWRDARTMIDALQRVADLNHVRTEKHSWRHGSIRWRQDYLRSLVGQPVGRLGIDRQMRVVNALSLGAVLTVVAMQAWLG